MALFKCHLLPLKRNEKNDVNSGKCKKLKLKDFLLSDKGLVTTQVLQKCEMFMTMMLGIIV